MPYKISVIIPVYNVEKYLRKCIDSVLCQKGIVFEIILVDDGSTDSSAFICDKYIEKYENIKVIHKKNEGLGYARNSGLEIASGEYIFFLDSDDWIVKGTLKTLYTLAKKNDADMVCFQYVMTPNREYVLATQEGCKVECVDNYELMKRYVSEMPATAWSKLYKRELFDAVKFTNVPIHEDAYSMHLFMEQVNRAVITDQIFYIQYIRPGSLTQSKFQEKNMLCIECGNRIVRFVEEKYPELCIYAHFNKIQRQLYTINLLLESLGYRQYKKTYYAIVKDLINEMNTVQNHHQLNENVYKVVCRLVRHPHLYAVNCIQKNYRGKVRAYLVDKIKGKKNNHENN